MIDRFCLIGFAALLISACAANHDPDTADFGAFLDLVDSAQAAGWEALTFRLSCS